MTNSFQFHVFILFQTKISTIKISRIDLMFYTFHGKFYSIPFATFNLEVIDTINFQRTED